MKTETDVSVGCQDGFELNNIDLSLNQKDLIKDESVSEDNKDVDTNKQQFPESKTTLNQDECEQDKSSSKESESLSEQDQCLSLQDESPEKMFKTEKRSSEEDTLFNEETLRTYSNSLKNSKLETSINHTVIFKDCEISGTYDLDPDTIFLNSSQGHAVGLNLSLRWQGIKKVYSTKVQGISDLENRIMSYSTENVRPCKGLRLYFDQSEPDVKKNFFEVILPNIIDLALQLPLIITQPIPLLKKMKSHKVTMTQKQAACLLCNAFLCTFTRRDRQMPYINFNRLFNLDTSVPCLFEKIKTILHYFDRIAHQIGDGHITFERRFINPKHFPNWLSCKNTFTNKIVVDNYKKIEDAGKGMLQVDFANKFIGGGVLNRGLVQEEIRFIICPELLVSLMLCEKMRPEESIIITGAEQYSSYTGYCSSYEWSGPYYDDTPRDEWNRRYTSIVAIDALCFNRNHSPVQYQMPSIKRELNKAYVGFYTKTDQPDAVATGNWGCGAFKGDPVLKAVIQLMACCVNNRQMCYCTWNDNQLKDDIEQIHGLFQHKNISVGDVWNILVNYSFHIRNSENPSTFRDYIFLELLSFTQYH